MSKYGYGENVNIRLGMERKERAIQRAEQVQIEKNKKTPNLSKVAQEAFDCYFEVLDLFGEDWRSQLAVQSRPKWVKNFKTEIRDIITEAFRNVSVVSREEKEQLTDTIVNSFEIDNEMWE